MNSFEVNIKIKDSYPSMKNGPRIGIVGGGVSGISSAVAVVNSFPQCPVTIFTDQRTPDTTGDGAAGLWGPYLPYGTPEEKILKWSLPTWKLLNNWCRRGDPGINYSFTTIISQDDLSPPIYKDMTYGYKELNQEQLKGFGSDYANGQSYTTIIAEPSYFLPRMIEQFENLGGAIVTKKLKSLDDISDEVDIIVNCSGLGSYELVPDSSMFPIRGQIILMKAPWVKNTLLDASEDSDCYIIPNTDKLILGGTHQEGDWSTTVDEFDKEMIFKKSCNVMPGIEKCEFVRDWVGLRPARKNGIRVEREEMISKFGKRTQVIHNYGHCGSGISLMWGCALETRDLVGEAINKYYFPPTCKL